MTQKEALEVLKTGANVFLTGAPGAGKTYVLREYINYLRKHGVNPSITASTGIASTHVGGATIHSWSGMGVKTKISDWDLEALFEKESLTKRLKTAKVLVIDEVSMITSDFLDGVNAITKALRGDARAFGGLQVVCVGDFFQLPPIIKNENFERDEEYEDTQIDFEEMENLGNAKPIQKRGFAFEGRAWKEAKFLTCYLKEQHRQEDQVFLDLLVSIRSGSVSKDHRKLLQSKSTDEEGVDKKITRLFTHNRDVDSINNRNLKSLGGELHKFEIETSGSKARIETLKKNMLAPEILSLKMGARVMFVRNNKDKGYVNGTQGEVSHLGHNKISVTITGGRVIQVEREDFTLEEDGKIKATISQFPIRLAWAITVHKSQGMSLDEAFMDLREVFEYGQGYVALSRVRTLNGLYLLGFNEKSLEVNTAIRNFDLKSEKDSEIIADKIKNTDKDKLKKTQEDFIVKNGGVLEEVDFYKDFKQDLEPRKDTFTQTEELIKAGEDLEGILNKRELKENTILDHFEFLLKEKRMTNDELIKIARSEHKKVPKEVRESFKKNGVEKLSPVFRDLQIKHGSKYTYDDLKWFRLLL